MSARQVTASETGAAIGICPGVMLIMPVNKTTRLLIDSEPFELYPNICLIVNGNSEKKIAPPYTNATSDGDEGCILRIIELSALLNSAYSIHEQLDTPCSLNNVTSEKIGTLYEQLVFKSHAFSLTPGSPDLSGHILAALLVSIVLESAPRTAKRSSSAAEDRKLTRLKQFLVENLTRPITTPDMAAHINMSRSAFCLWAPDALGTTPARYLRRLRLERSQDLLTQGSMPVDEIADLTGFADRAHLSREFKAHFSITPVQCRRLTKRTPDTDHLQEIAYRISRNEFRSALDACEEGIKSATSASVRDKIRFEKANCLRAIGQTARAMAEWQSLRGGSYGHAADIERCRLFFTADEYDDALNLLHSLYAEANDVQRNDVINLWMDQTLILAEQRTVRPLRKYLEFRKKFFAADQRSMHMTLSLLNELGENNEVPCHCSQMYVACFNALRRAGKLDEAFDQYGMHIDPLQAAVSLYLFGRAEEMLAKYPDIDPDFSAKALVSLGRAEEAIDRYPTHSAPAYIALGRYEELLERFPAREWRIPERIYALHTLGRTDELKLYSRHDEWLWVQAQLYSAPQALLEENLAGDARQRNAARLLVALDEFICGNDSRGKELAGQIQGVRDQNFWWLDHHSDILLSTLICGISGGRKELAADLKEIEANHKFKDKQALWHDASYLRDRISRNIYLSQPQQTDIRPRFDFIDAVSHDLKGEPELAAKGYRAFLANSQPYGAYNLIRHRFAEWRLSIIA